MQFPGAKGRNEKLKMLTAIGDHFKKQIWGWLWTEAGKHPKLEKSLRIGGAGYPVREYYSFHYISYHVLCMCTIFL